MGVSCVCSAAEYTYGKPRSQSFTAAIVACSTNNGYSRTASDHSCGEGLGTRLHLRAATVNAGAPVEWFGVIKIIASYILLGPHGC